jgi:DNA-binding transcriptional MerR regulator
MAARGRRETDVRISDVVRKTGLSKELIHHYLRLGLIPKSDRRGRYDERQVRLLRLVRTLREDHNLPLEVVRSLFDALGFAPGRLESLTQSESLCNRITRFADGSVIAGETLDGDALARRSGVSGARIGEYISAGILAPTRSPDGERFSPYDANVVALCERGVELGIPFESLRTAASYVHVAFELEKTGFFGGIDTDGSPNELLRELFLRQEVVLSFVQNMLQSVTQLHVREELSPSFRYEQSLDDVLYQPSSAFVRRHRIDARINEARSRCAQATTPESWLDVAELLLHAGRYHEAVFLLEDCFQRWPRAQAHPLYGRAVLLAGDAARGELLLSQALTTNEDDPRVPTYLALAKVQRANVDRRPEALVGQGSAILALVDQAVASGSPAPSSTSMECRLLCGWLLTALPQSLGCAARGRKLLERVLQELPDAPLADDELPGLRQRLQVNAAYLLLRSNGHPPGERDPSEPFDAERLRTLICRLDPASDFAQAVFLDDHRLRPATEISS